MGDIPLNRNLQAQQDKMEQLRLKRVAAKSLYLPPEVQPLLDDIADFVDAQSIGCKDRASTTDSEFIANRALHMMLMADIIKTYITNQRKTTA